MERVNVRGWNGVKIPTTEHRSILVGESVYPDHVRIADYIGASILASVHVPQSRIPALIEALELVHKPVEK